MTVRSPVARRLLNKARHVSETIRQRALRKGPGDYPTDPVGYITNILGVKVLWERQAEAARALLKPPYRVLMPSGHSTGKTFLAAALVNWWYDSFTPGVAISTAPDHRSVCDLLWSEIRLQRQRVGLGGLMPASPEMRTGPDHYAKGFTALSGNSFQGRHPERLLIVMDEAAGVDPVFWQTSETMFQPRQGHAWLAILNPTDTGCQAYAEDQMVDGDGNPKWRRFSLDCLEHPNVKGRGPNDPPIIPNAVSWHQVNEWVHAWCDPVPPSEANKAQDLEWPAGSGKYWRQGPVFLARCRGRWPTGQAFAVWTDSLWAQCTHTILPPPSSAIPEIGCDVARFGDDFTAIHVRWGHTSVYHDARNGWNTVQIATWLKETADRWAAEATKVRPSGAKPITGNRIPIKVDDDGVGGGVVDLLQSWGYMAIPIGAGTRSISGRYPNKRSELWFQVADRATSGHLALGRLPSAILARMRQQALAVQWKMSAAGQRVVEPKDATKEKLGRSPDDLDALNLAYLEGYEFATAEFIEGNQRPVTVGEVEKQLGGKVIERPDTQKRKIW